MKKIVIIFALALMTLGGIAVAQSKLTLVMDYRWNFNSKTNTLLSESKCTDGIEFNFNTNKAKYYTPDYQNYETLCKILKVIEPKVAKDGTTTYGFSIYEVGRERDVDCVLTVSSDLKKIKFSMLAKDGTADIYNVADMLTDE